MINKSVGRSYRARPVDHVGQESKNERGVTVVLSISVIVPTFQRKGALPGHLAPLLADPGSHEVIVVVDGSTDGSMELLQNMAARHERLCPILIANSGQGAARQRGLEESTGDVVLFLDDDVEADPGLVSKHRDRHAQISEPGTIVLGYMPTTLPTHNAANTFTTVLYSREYELRCLAFESAPDDVITHMWGGNISMRRADALAIGMKNPEYPRALHEDRDWGLRCQEGGMRAVFDRSLSARHQHERLASAFFRDASRQGMGLAYLHRLHPQLGPLDESRFWSGLPAPLALVVRASSQPGAYRSLHSGLLRSVKALGKQRQWKRQIQAAQLLRRIEQRRGAALGIRAQET